MPKRMKRSRGFYRSLKPYNYRKERIAVVEFWLQHKEDPAKDVHFYVYWMSESEIGEAMQYLREKDKSDYKDHTWIRHIAVPRTRRQRAIYKSRMSSLNHLSKFLDEFPGEAEQNTGLH